MAVSIGPSETFAQGGTRRPIERADFQGRGIGKVKFLGDIVSGTGDKNKGESVPKGSCFNCRVDGRQDKTLTGLMAEYLVCLSSHIL
jgi:hypothetical protein